MSITFHIKDSAYVPIFTLRGYIICCLPMYTYSVVFFSQGKKGAFILFWQRPIYRHFTKSICLLFGFHLLSIVISGWVGWELLLNDPPWILSNLVQNYRCKQKKTRHIYFKLGIIPNPFEKVAWICFGNLPLMMIHKSKK